MPSGGAASLSLDFIKNMTDRMLSAGHFLYHLPKKGKLFAPALLVCDNKNYIKNRKLT